MTTVDDIPNCSARSIPRRICPQPSSLSNADPVAQVLPGQKRPVSLRGRGHRLAYRSEGNIRGRAPMTILDYPVISSPKFTQKLRGRRHGKRPIDRGRGMRDS